MNQLSRKKKYLSVFISCLVMCCFFWLLSSCSEPPKSEKKPFEQYFDFREEVKKLERLNPKVRKSVIKDKASQTIFDTVNWKTEFAPFLESDINRPQYKNNYDISTLIGEQSSIVKYIAREKSMPVQLVEITYQDEFCTHIFIRRIVSGDLGETVQELFYETNVGYAIIGRQSTDISPETSYEIRGKFYDFPFGTWRALLDLNGEELPFNFEMQKLNYEYVLHVINGTERIRIEVIPLKADSILIKFPIYDSEIKGRYVPEVSITGTWYNFAKGPDYKIPFLAEYAKEFRFMENAPKRPMDFSGKWEADFNPGSKDAYKAIGLFEQQKNHIGGTFLTETGDYRYLDGTVNGDSLYLSCFDGAHAFLFKARQNENGTLNGMFWSGKHLKEQWTARRNEQFELKNPDSLTFINPGAKKLEFALPDIDNKIVTFADRKYRNKAVIVQILGTWCPNCKDETALLADLYKQYNSNGLEIIGIAFERTGNFTKASEGLTRFKLFSDAGYNFLIADVSGKKKPNQVLPVLQNFISYPTTLFLDKTGEIVSIHTGFNGPGTGNYYDQTKAHYTGMVKKLLNIE